MVEVEGGGIIRDVEFFSRRDVFKGSLKEGQKGMNSINLPSPTEQGIDRSAFSPS